MLSYWWANKIPWSGMDFCRNGKYPDLSEFLVGKALRNHGMLVCPNWLNKKTLPTQPIFGVQWNIGGLNDVLLEQKCNLLFTLI